MTPFSFKDINLHYKISGEGSPVLFIHGFMEDHSMWKDVAKEVENLGKQSIVIDLPCHGKSRFERESISITEMAEAVDALLSELELSDVALVGHSLGGYVGLELLRIRPINLTLLHSNFWEDSDDKKNDRDRVISIVKRAKDIFINEAIPHLFHPDNKSHCKDDIQDLIEKALQIPADEIAACSYGLRDRRSQHELFDKHEIHVIHGIDDPILPIEKFESELEKIGGKADVYLIENCGHMSIWEQPQALNESLKKILIK